MYIRATRPRLQDVPGVAFLCFLLKGWKTTKKQSPCWTCGRCEYAAAKYPSRRNATGKRPHEAIRGLGVAGARVSGL